MKRQADARLTREAAMRAAPRPKLLTIGMFLSIALGVMCLLMVPSASVNVGENGVLYQQVSGHEFLATPGAPLALFGFLCLAIAYTTSRDWWWSRYLILAFWPAFIVFGSGGALLAGQSLAQAAWGALIVTVTLVAPTAAYLFYNKHAVAYYDARRPGSDESRT